MHSVHRSLSDLDDSKSVTSAAHLQLVNIPSVQSFDYDCRESWMGQKVVPLNLSKLHLPVLSKAVIAAGAHGASQNYNHKKRLDEDTSPKWVHSLRHSSLHVAHSRQTSLLENNASGPNNYLSTQQDFNGSSSILWAGPAWTQADVAAIIWTDMLRRCELNGLWKQGSG